MARSSRSTPAVVCCLLFGAGTLAQSAGLGSCGSNINASRPWYEIRFVSQCNTKLYGTNTFPAIQASTFADCSTACVNKGPTCGGITYDRESHISEDNCYLLHATSDTYASGSSSENVWFDSATIDNGSIPITRRDCENVGDNGVYRGFDLRCNQGIFDGPASSSSGTPFDTVFASAITDCVDHCYSTRFNTSSQLCQAVTWDPSMIYGYQNCILKGPGYVEPIGIGAWDSATLVGTTGRVLDNSTTSSSASSGTSTSTTSTPSSSSTSTSSPTSSSSAPSSPAPQQEQNPSSAKISRKVAGGIAGGVVGGVVTVLALAVIIMRRRIRKSVEAHHARPMRHLNSRILGPVYEIFTPKSHRKPKELDSKEVKISELDATQYAELETPVATTTTTTTGAGAGKGQGSGGGGGVGGGNSSNTRDEGVRYA